MNSRTCDFLVIGAGIIGLNIARHLKKDFPDAKIIVLEKEKECGFHASGRNSGVIHAGFYYTPDSLKAKFTRLGNQQLTEYCKQRKIPLNQCGKLVVAKNEAELISLDLLFERGEKNGVVLQELTELEAKQIEPRALTYKRALFSPSTASVNPQHVLKAMREDAEREGVIIHCDVKYIKRKNTQQIVTSKGDYHAKFTINAAGLYADKIAKDFSFCHDYRILPFKGIYLYSNEPTNSLNTLIYPVPDLKNPFLGVHFTINAEGKAKLGPTAIPALWREQYDFYHRFSLAEFFSIMGCQLGLLWNAQFDFKRLAMEEIKKYSKAHMVKLSTALASGVKKENYTSFGVPGIRAQLLNIKKRKLEMDFIVEGDMHSMHVLNAVSPGFTSSLPFTEYVCQKIKDLIA
jgi:L-2-hydroxyglutarate oxidase